MIKSKNITIYHEIDFLLPAQRFNINFSYISQRGLPFVREFILRLVHLSPMSKTQIAVYFGFSRLEIDEAISDLVGREELMLSTSGRLMLTEKSVGYFSEIGEVPRLSLLQDSGTILSFDLATFTCLGNITSDKWKAGVSIRVASQNFSTSETQVEKNFQIQFNEILNKKFLAKHLLQVENETPTIYTVNSVDKIGQMPLRLTVNFNFDEDGSSVEREDFELLKNSDFVQEQITIELSKLGRTNNSVEIAKAMMDIKDDFTLKLVDSKTNLINLKYFDDLARLEGNTKDRTTFLGPIYSQANWDLLQKYLAPLLLSRIESKKDIDQSDFLWIAPSDPYWGKSNRILTSLSDFHTKASTKEKKLYSPTLYLPIAGKDDISSIRQWRQDLEPYLNEAHGLIEGFLGGNVEVLYLENEMAAVVYHMSIPENYPVSMPIGFISTQPETVTVIGKLIKEYISGSAGFDHKNDCGYIYKTQPSQKSIL